MAIPSGNKTNQKLVQELASLRQRIGQLEATPPIHGSATSETTGSLGLGPAYHELDVGLCLFDLDLRFLYINTWLAALNGLSVDDHVGQIIDDVLPGVAGNVGPQLRHVIESGESIVGGFVETETPARPGEIRVFEHSYHPVRSDDGTIDGLACVVEEITERRKDGESLREEKKTLQDNVLERTSELETANRALLKEVAERREAEKKLRESEARLMDIAAAGADWFWQTDTEHRFEEFVIGDWVEPGFRADISRGGTRQDFAAPEDVAKNPDKWRRHWEDHEDHRPFRDFIYSAHIPDHGLVWLRANGVPRFDENDQFIGYNGVTSNITAEVQAEQRAQSSEQRLLGALEHLSGRIAMFDAEDRLLYANGSWFDFHDLGGHQTGAGITYEEALRKLVAAKTMKIAPGHEEVWIQSRLASRLKPGNLFENTDNDGRTFIVHDHRLPDGGLISIAADSTANKQAEDSRKAMEARLAGIVDVAVEAIISIDEDRRIRMFNPSAERMFGFAAEEILGEPIEHLVPMKYREAHPAQVSEFHGAKETNRTLGIRGEITGQRKDGSTFPARATISKFISGDATVFTAHVEDITEQKRAEKEKSNLLAQLGQAQKMETIGTLAGGIAHDFNNLLAPILGHTEMAMDSVSSDDPVRRHLEPVFSGAMRAAELVKQILTFSRQGKSHRQQISVSDSVREILGLLRAATPSTIKIVENIDIEIQPIYADTTEVHQLIMNLCTNGVQAMDSDSGVMEVRLGNFDVDEAFAAAHHGLEIGPMSNCRFAMRVAV